MDIPLVGLGTRQLTGPDCYRVVRDALDIGYRHIDSADRYKNAKEIGQALCDSGISREDVFLTSKLWVDCFGPQGKQISDRHARQERYSDIDYRQCIDQRLQMELEHFQTSYLDLVLLHRPTTIDEHNFVFDVLLSYKKKGIIRHIGISNFSYSQFDDALKYLAGDLFAVQYEYHVCLDQSYLLDKCRQHGIVFEAYSPFAHGKLRNSTEVMSCLECIAHKHSISISQVMLSYLADQNIVVLPKSQSSKHLLQNLHIPVGLLDEKDKISIAGFPKSFRYCGPVAIAPQWTK